MQVPSPPSPIAAGQRRLRVAVVIGTRPEGVKMAPIIRELGNHTAAFDARVISTAQHEALLDDVLGVFRICPHHTLNLMRPNQAVADLAARALADLAALFARLDPDLVLVQGDTTTTTAAALAGFYHGAKVAHVEAGLRSFDPARPFPEEINRRLTTCLAALHFAPTDRARQNLLAEGVPSESVFVTGNTVVDALQSVQLEEAFDNPDLAGLLDANRRLLLVTAHRRENLGSGLDSICEALKTLIKECADLQIVYPVHLNPLVQEAAARHLSGIPYLHPIAPLTYGDLLRLMQRCVLVLTDSGGLQEEAPSFRKPVLVLRDVTERPELLESGAGLLVGTDVDRIVDTSLRLLRDPPAYRAMQTASNPFGDGRAAGRIVNLLLQRRRTFLR